MLGSTAITAVLGSGVNSTDHEAVRFFLRSAADAGLSLLLIEPGSKRPFDGRTARKRTADDKAAQQAAKDAGRRDWARVKSPAGLALATSDKNTLTKKNGYLDEYVKTFGPDVAVNVAVEIGGSGLVIIDCDTDAQRERFLEVVDAPDNLPPTVISPGTQNPDTGEWLHEPGNGHYWFTLNDAEREALPRNAGAMTWGGENGFAVLWDRHYVLIPPSTRAEGAYELVGRDYPCPDTLIEAITAYAGAKASRAHNNAAPATDDLSTAIDDWAETITWAEILEPLGWTPAARPDQCGCEVFTAPGVHASPKSATAHDAGCALGRYTETNAPLHIWTDNPGEPFDAYVDEHHTKTLSKLQAVAWAHYGGNIGTAMDALDLGPAPHTIEREEGVDPRSIDSEVDARHDPAEPLEMRKPPRLPGEPRSTMLRESDPPVRDATPRYSAEVVKVTLIDEAGEPVAEDEKRLPEDDSQLSDDDITDEKTPPHSSDGVGEADDTADDEFPGDTDRLDNPDVLDTGIQGMPVIAPFSHWRHLPPPEFIIDGLIEAGGLCSMIGPSGVGKSSVVLDMACCIATGKPWQGRKVLKTRVLYLPGEGLNGAVQRINAWADVHEIPEQLIDDGLRLGNQILQLGASSEAWIALADYIVRQHIGLVVFDTFARMSLGIEENSATEVGRAVVRFDQVRRLTNAGVLLVHHTPKANPKVSRGSGALTGALDSELCVTEAEWDFDSLGLVDEDGHVPAGKPIQLDTTKQKNAEQLEHPIPLLMRNNDHYSAPYVTGANGETDPMLGKVVLARPRPEPDIETAIRIRVFLDRLTAQGATRAEIAAGVRPDPYTAGRGDSPRAWKQKVALAVDLALRYELIETASGTRLGARYVPGEVNAEDARTGHAHSVITDEPDQQGGVA